jgi:aarF domain-containing kinase
MLKPTFSSLVTKRLFAPGWTCARCRSSQLSRTSLFRLRAPLSRQYGSSSGPSLAAAKPKSRRRPAVLLATAAGGGAAAMLLSVGDDVRNGYDAIERTGRVAATLVLCINE